VCCLRLLATACGCFRLLTAAAAHQVTEQPQAELLEELCVEGQYTEPHCRRAFRGLASALARLEEKGVVRLESETSAAILHARFRATSNFIPVDSSPSARAHCRR